MERRKAVAALMIVAAVAGCITAAAVAAAPSLSLKASDIAKAILPGGFINPKAIMPGAITTEHLADSAVTSAKIADGTIATADIANNAVTADKIAEGAVNTTDIADGTIATADIANNAVTADKIAEGAVNTTDIADGTIATADIADDAVTSAKIADHTVAEGNLASGAIPHITHFKAGITSLDALEKEVLNTTADGVTLTTSAIRDFIIIYSVNVSEIGGSAPGWVNISKVDIIDNNGAFVKRATPQEVRIADYSTYGKVVTATFYADDVSAGARGVSVTVTTDEIGGKLHNQTIVVIAL